MALPSIPAARMPPWCSPACPSCLSLLQRAGTEAELPPPLHFPLHHWMGTSVHAAALWAGSGTWRGENLLFFLSSGRTGAKPASIFKKCGTPLWLYLHNKAKKTLRFLVWILWTLQILSEAGRKFVYSCNYIMINTNFGNRSHMACSQPYSAFQPWASKP